MAPRTKAPVTNPMSQSVSPLTIDIVAEVRRHSAVTPYTKRLALIGHPTASAAEPSAAGLAFASELSLDLVLGAPLDSSGREPSANGMLRFAPCRAPPSPVGIGGHQRTNATKHVAVGVGQMGFAYCNEYV